VNYHERAIAAWRRTEHKGRLADQLTLGGTCYAMAGEWQRAYKSHSECFGILESAGEGEYPYLAASIINTAIAAAAAGDFGLLPELARAEKLARSCSRNDLAATGSEREHMLLSSSGNSLVRLAQSLAVRPLLEMHPGFEFHFREDLPKSERVATFTPSSRSGTTGTNQMDQGQIS
jgi:hypothetical protein